MISLSAPRYPLPRLEEGRVTHFLPGSRHFLVCPPSPFTPQNICSFWIHCCSHLPGSMMSLLTSCWAGQKEEEKLTAVMVTFFSYFECDLQGLSVQILFQRFALCSQTSQVVQPSGWGAWAQWPQESLASLYLPLAWSLEQSSQGFGSLYTAAPSINQT